MESTRIPEPFRSDIEKAVEVLRSFGTKKIYLFGSLTSDLWHDGSDIDLAVSGMAPELYLRAYAMASRGLEHELDLIDIDHERPLGDFLMETDRLVRIA
jgi:predicted nucleotidyltransferase